MFRTTAFDPYPKVDLQANDPSLNFTEMEQLLAREMHKMKITDEQKRR
jgi:hypothetical protein